MQKLSKIKSMQITCDYEYWRVIFQSPCN